MHQREKHSVNIFLSGIWGLWDERRQGATLSPSRCWSEGWRAMGTQRGEAACPQHQAAQNSTRPSHSISQEWRAENESHSLDLISTSLFHWQLGQTLGSEANLKNYNYRPWLLVAAFNFNLLSGFKTQWWEWVLLYVGGCSNTEIAVADMGEKKQICLNNCLSGLLSKYLAIRPSTPKHTFNEQVVPQILRIHTVTSE